MTSGLYSDRRRFFSMKSQHLLYRCQKKLMVGAEYMELWFRIRVCIKLLIIYRLSYH